MRVTSSLLACYYSNASLRFCLVASFVYVNEGLKEGSCAALRRKAVSKGMSLEL